MTVQIENVDTDTALLAECLREAFTAAVAEFGTADTAAWYRVAEQAKELAWIEGLKR